MKKLLLICWITTVIFVFKTFSQVGLPPSPNAAALGNYVASPVGLYTGTVPVNIPLYTLTSRQLSVPISLSYHGGGIKVEEVSTDVGLGWSLNAGGCITRTVCVKPDEADSGFFNQGGSLITEPGGVSGSYWERYNLGVFDGMPDKFYFNFLGRTGQIIFDKNKNPYIIPKQDLLIPTPTISSNRITEWTIYDETGTKYVFSDNEIVDAKACVPLTDGSFNRYDDYNSAWYLSRIESADGRDIIYFTYTRPNAYRIFLMNSQKFHYQNEVDAPPIDEVYTGHQFPKVYENRTTISGLRLSQISTDNYSVKFIYNSNGRRDLIFDLTGTQPAPLSEIQIINNIAPNEYLKKYVLSQTYSTWEDGTVSLSYGTAGQGLTDYRLILNSITEYDKLGNHNPPYTFYYNSDGSLPSRKDVNSLDYWGYFNGKGENETLIPATTFTDYRNSIVTVPVFEEYRANRDPDISYAIAGSLKKVVYPTGGYTEYEYELNTSTSTLLPGSLTERPAGGIRIATIKTNDGSNNILTEIYSYDDASGLTSGKLTGFAKYGNHMRITEGGYNYNYFVVSAESNYPLATTNGTTVGYEWVTVDKGAMGKIKYHFYTPDDNPDLYEIYKVDVEHFDSMYSNAGQIQGYYSLVVNNDWKRGQVREEYVYNSSNDLLQRKIYNYNIHGPSSSFLCLADEFSSYWDPDDGTNQLLNFAKYYHQRCNYSITLASVDDYIYDPSNPSVYTQKTTNYYYDSPHLLMPSYIKTTDGKGGYDIVKNMYIADYSYSTLNDIVTTHHVTGLIVEQRLYKQKPNNDVYVVGGTVKNYHQGKSLTNPYEVYSLEISTPILVGHYDYTYSGLYSLLYPVNFNYVLKATYDFNYFYNLVNATPVNGNKKAYIYAYNNTLTAATIENSNNVESFFSSYEENNDFDLIAKKCTTDYHTGNMCCYVAPGSYNTCKDFPITTLLKAKYKYSAWVKTSATGVSLKIKDLGDQNPSFVTSVPNTNGNWQYFEVEADMSNTGFSNCATIRVEIYNSSTTNDAYVDDVRFYPSDAIMTSYTYDLYGNVTSVTDANHKTIYYGYDGFGRLVSVKDENHKLFEKRAYHFNNW